MRRLMIAVMVGGSIAVAIGPGAVVHALEIPFLSQRVTDLAEIVDPDVEERLDAALRDLEAETGAQVAVLTVPSLDGEILEDFSVRVVEAWQLGREGVDDGVLLLVAHQDRKIRIEVGYGLEGAITDLQGRQIIDALIVPSFRQGDFGAGIEAGVGSIMGAIRGEADAIPAPAAAQPGSVSGDGAFLIMIFLFMFGRAAVTQPGRGGWLLFAGLSPIFFALMLASFGLTAALVFTVGWIVVGALWRLFGPKIPPGKRGRRRRGGWHSGPWIGGGGFSGGGGGFGGFSGGGGSFGGGGASGSW